ncbi:unnamed protein product, partial [Discosporangium mesarthrocarpum]
ATAPSGGANQDRHMPCKVENLHSKVKQVFAGSVHTCVLTVGGAVYTFGKHEYTGHGERLDILSPRLITAFGDVPVRGSGGAAPPHFCFFPGRQVRQISVGPGGYHTMALTCQGKVYAWGHNRVGQLGYANSKVVPKNMEGAYFLPSPQMVESLGSMV